MLRDLDDKPGIVQALTSLGFIAAPMAAPDSGRGYLSEAVALAGELGDEPSQAYALALQGRAAINRPADRPSARVAVRRAIEISRRCGDVRTEGTAVLELGVLSALDGNPAEAMPYLEEALPLLRACGEAFFRSLCLVCMVHCLAIVGATEKVDQACAELDEITAELGAATLYYAYWARGWASFCLGEWDAAILAYQSELTYPGPVGLAGLPVATLAWSQLRAGHSDGALRTLGEFLGANDPARTCPALPLAVRALVARAQGDLGFAQDTAHQALAAAPDDPFGKLTMWTCLTVMAAVSADAGDHLLAARLAGAVSRLGGEIGIADLPAHAQLLEYVRAVCHQSVGADAYARAEAEGARANAAEALAYANRGRGARLRPASGWDSLTPTEIRVAAAVSDGLSNPQIADRMFISRRTVTTHLTSIFRKLGVSSRAALAAAEARSQSEDGRRARSMSRPPDA